MVNLLSVRAQQVREANAKIVMGGPQLIPCNHPGRGHASQQPSGCREQLARSVGSLEMVRL